MPAGVQLQGNHARTGRVRCVFISDVGHLLAVDEMLEVIALGDDHVFVPAIGLNVGLDLGVISPKVPRTFSRPVPWPRPLLRGTLLE